jgi:Zn-dependent protease
MNFRLTATKKNQRQVEMIALKIVFAFWSTFYLGTLIHELGHYAAARLLTKLNATDFKLLGWITFKVRDANPAVAISAVVFHGCVSVSGDPNQPPAPTKKVSWQLSSGRDRLVFMLGGPLAHALMALALIYVCSTVKTEPNEYSIVKFIWYFLGWIQLAMALGNLVPGRVSDGGHIIRVLYRKSISADLWMFHPGFVWSGRLAVMAACFFGLLQWPGFKS